jgi:hypothetical protein
MPFEVIHHSLPKCQCVSSSFLGHFISWSESGTDEFTEPSLSGLGTKHYYPFPQREFKKLGFCLCLFVSSHRLIRCMTRIRYSCFQPLQYRWSFAGIHTLNSWGI